MDGYIIFWAEFWLDFEGMRWNGWLIRQTCLRGDVPDAAFQYDHQLMISFDACTTINRGAPPSFRFFSVKILPWKSRKEAGSKRAKWGALHGAHLPWGPQEIATPHHRHGKTQPPRARRTPTLRPQPM